MTISLLAGLCSPLPEVVDLFSLSVILMKLLSTRVISSKVPLVVLSIFEMPHLTLSRCGSEVAAADPPCNTGMESVLTSCQFRPRAFSFVGLLGGASGKEPACQSRRCLRDVGSIPGSERSLGEGHGNPLVLPGESHEQRSLVGYKFIGSQRVRHYWSHLSRTHHIFSHKAISF